MLCGEIANIKPETLNELPQAGHWKCTRLDLYTINTATKPITTMGVKKRAMLKHLPYVVAEKFLSYPANTQITVNQMPVRFPIPSPTRQCVLESPGLPLCHGQAPCGRFVAPSQHPHMLGQQRK